MINVKILKSWLHNFQRIFFIFGSATCTRYVHVSNQHSPQQLFVILTILLGEWNSVNPEFNRKINSLTNNYSTLKSNLNSLEQFILWRISLSLITCLKHIESWFVKKKHLYSLCIKIKLQKISTKKWVLLLFWS